MLHGHVRVLIRVGAHPATLLLLLRKWWLLLLLWWELAGGLGEVALVMLLEELLLTEEAGRRCALRSPALRHVRCLGLLTHHVWQWVIAQELVLEQARRRWCTRLGRMRLRQVGWLIAP